jgi:hypothetical protein
VSRILAGLLSLIAVPVGLLFVLMLFAIEALEQDGSE